MRPRARPLAGPALALLTAACADPEYEVERGEHLVYAWEPELTPCAGNLAHLDALVVHVAAQLDLDVERFDPLGYHWVRHETYRRFFPTLEETTGSARWGDAYAWHPLLDHEVVHTVVDQPGACAAPTIPWEGERWQDLRALECDADDVGGGLDEGGVGVMTRSITLEIPAAGSYLVERFGDDGIDAILQPCGRCPWLAVDHGLMRVGLIELQAGLHAIRYRAPAGALALGGVVLTPVEVDMP
ncbi:MAG: hypothetical protein R3B09_26625 [Nannocystaceae bacterium]